MKRQGGIENSCDVWQSLIPDHFFWKMVHTILTFGRKGQTSITVVEVEDNFTKVCRTRLSQFPAIIVVISKPCDRMTLCNLTIKYTKQAWKHVNWLQSWSTVFDILYWVMYVIPIVQQWLVRRQHDLMGKRDAESNNCKPEKSWQKRQKLTNFWTTCFFIQTAADTVYT